MDKNQFKRNMLKAISDAGIDFDPLCSKFIITPILEEKIKYNSYDEYIQRGLIDRANLGNRSFKLDEAVDFLAQPNLRYPFWIKILCNKIQGSCVEFELKISIRFRTPSQLKYIDSGHPPFVVERQ